ncbi:MAG: hypothetical protein ACRD6N_17680 [Pyrinomonadaceae bacterium]
MTLFFDRSVGVTIPQTLLRLKPPVDVAYHQEHFAFDEADDVWIPEVTKWGWFIIGQDYSYHKNPSELTAMKQHGAAVFYLWGAEAKKWEALRCFARGFDNILRKTETDTRPYAYTVQKHGGVTELYLP